MPTYSYKCSSCDYEWEGFNSMSDIDKQQCPKCGEKAVLNYNAGCGDGTLLIKGSGFYQERTVR